MSKSIHLYKPHDFFIDRALKFAIGANSGGFTTTEIWHWESKSFIGKRDKHDYTGAFWDIIELTEKIEILYRRVRIGSSTKWELKRIETRSEVETVVGYMTTDDDVVTMYGKPPGSN